MTELFVMYEVGGKVRDEILGLKSKDVDYVAVPNETLLREYTEASDMFQVLSDYLTAEKFEIFLETPGCFTIRARFPEGHKYEGVADFVMARKELGYISGTRTPKIVPGSLYDDLARRDFRLNALAKGSDGKIIDYFNGIQDLKDGILRTPLDCQVTFDDDPLRILRAARLSITKEFTMCDEIIKTIKTYDYETKMFVVSSERIREELLKCFKYDTMKTILLLNEFPRLRDYIFTRTKLWLKPTFEA
jgi:tRNA nucleotidyltransferase/poly(A) polymerase